MEINAKKFPIEIRADIWRKNQNFKINPKGISVDGVVKEARISNFSMGGLCLDIDTRQKGLVIRRRK